jgi:protein-tyrosine-phosphatase
MNILFVCTGNSCRSFMAEYYALDKATKMGLTGVSFTSAGTGAWNGAPPTTEAVRLLAKDGIDGSHHQARLLTADMLAQTDLAVCMTLCHIDEVRELWGKHSAGHIMLLGDAESPGLHIKPDGEVSGINLTAGQRRELEIPDPIGMDEDFYRTTYSRIKEFVDKLLSTIKTG